MAGAVQAGKKNWYNLIKVTTMDEKLSPLTVFANEAPAVATAFNNLVDALRQTNGLDEKTKHLIYIAMKAGTGDTTAVYYHVPMAKQLGATRDEIKDAILLTLTVYGLQPVASCLPLALQVVDKNL